MQHADLIAGEGLVICCPGCGATIGRLRKPLYQNWTFGLDQVSFAAGQAPGRDMKAECRGCRTAYATMSIRAAAPGQRRWRVHTSYGWLPKDLATGATPGEIVRVNGSHDPPYDRVLPPTH
jgi:hypothetical protein